MVIKKLQVVNIGQKQMDRYTAPIKGVHGMQSQNGKRIYFTNKATRMDKEHELAHCRLGHKASVNSYQYMLAELSAERMAKRRMGRDIHKSYMQWVARDVRKIYPNDRKIVRERMNKAAKRLGIRHRI